MSPFAITFLLLTTASSSEATPLPDAFNVFETSGASGPMWTLECLSSGNSIVFEAETEFPNENIIKLTAADHEDVSWFTPITAAAMACQLPQVFDAEFSYEQRIALASQIENATP